MRLLIDASGLQRELATSSEEQASLLKALDRLLHSLVDEDLRIALRGDFPGEAIQIRKMVSYDIDASKVVTCAMPENLSPGTADQWYRGFLGYLGADLVVDFETIRAVPPADLSEKLIEPAEGRVQPTSAKKIAFVSPLPPSRTGIADYSAELLRELCERFSVEVVVDQDEVTDPFIRQHCQVRSAEWLVDNQHDYDSIIYHIGNSAFHAYQMPLIRRAPGIVVLHDFFLGDLQFARQQAEPSIPFLWRSVYRSDGYRALVGKSENRPAELIRDYPANYDVARYSTGLIVHSDFSRQLLNQQYPAIDQRKIYVIPHLRQPEVKRSRDEARARLGLSEGDFLTCTFGVVGPNKLAFELLEAWQASRLSASPGSKLAFVGEAGGHYGDDLRKRIDRGSSPENVWITGWAEAEIFHDYLAAADLAVQLRANSRGETSGTILDCMNYSVPTIVNANGSMAELPAESVYMLRNKFDRAELEEALDAIATRPELARRLSEQGRQAILEYYCPELCAEKYASVIAGLVANRPFTPNEIVQNAISSEQAQANEDCAREIFRAAALNFGGAQIQRTVHVDVTATAATELKTGIERVARALLREMALHGREDVRVEAVALRKTAIGWRYCYARRFMSELLGINGLDLDDSPIEPVSGDCLVALDVAGQPVIEAQRQGVFDTLRAHGVHVSFLVHDILPLMQPEVFPPGAEEGFRQWLDAVGESSDQIIGVTKTVSDNVQNWMMREMPGKNPLPEFFWSHHGADFSASAFDSETSASELFQLPAQSTAPVFLMVGTIEPRKRYDLALDLFDQLWESGEHLILVIVGKEGWQDQPDDRRRNIPSLVERFRNHPQQGKRLFWFNGIGDEALSELYRRASALLALSDDEGFGLPLIEASQRGLPVIARDIGVFREVAGDGAWFLSGASRLGEPVETDILAMASQLRDWLALYARNEHPDPRTMRWKTWRESADCLLSIVLNEKKV
ncbi:glycosyltransferase [Marinobacter pelagius]|uniref:Glycosyltransferase involved in cell wall bisynthesis n=1 Tax=Marinobacter pelagius TaxID=379482 RepID=A0A1I4TZU6_9GAMM|nr:glycosyltransferase [Marinobacter pelagius]SFM82282.1 Glycosyltransferase involved in cell wall bisynthesis [Marinobacter pelagius]